MIYSKKIFYALFTTAVVLTGCSQNEKFDEVSTNGTTNHEATGVVFRLQTNAPTSTRSAEDSYSHVQGSADEYKVNKARVYLFDTATKLYVKSFPLTDLTSKGTSSEGNIIYETAHVLVPQGTYDIFVTANTDRVINKDNEMDFLADIDSMTYVRAHIEDISNGIVMTNRASANCSTVIAKNPTNSDNVINILLERVLARIDVAKGADKFELTDEASKLYATVQLERYYIVNLPKYFYSYRHTAVMTNMDVPTWDVKENFGNIKDVDGYVIDPYFFQKKIDATAFANSDKYYENYYGDYNAAAVSWTTLKPVGTAGPQYKTIYSLENCMLAPAQKNAYSTGIVFDAKLEPNNNVYHLSGGTLQPTTTMPEVLYYYNYNFYDSAEALAVAIGVTSVDNADLEQYNARKFEKTDDGYRCYYTYWIRHLDNNRPTNMGVMEFGIVRNNLYRLLVTNVSGLGSNVTVPDPDCPDEGETYLKIVLNVKPWIVRDLTNIVL